MKRYLIPPKKLKLVHINFSLDSLRLLASAIDPSASRACLRHTKGEDLTPEEEAKALELHQQARSIALELLRGIETELSKTTDPLIFLALALEKAREGAK